MEVERKRSAEIKNMVRKSWFRCKFADELIERGGASVAESKDAVINALENVLV